MISLKQSEINKNKIVDWLKEDTISFKEIDLKKVPDFLWCIDLGLGSIITYTRKPLPDRVFIQVDILFTDEQQDMLNKQWNKTKLAQLQLRIVSSLTNLNVRHHILHDKDKNFTGIRIFSFLIDNLNKENFLNSFFRLNEVLNATLMQVSATVGIELQALKDQQKASSFNPLAT